MVIKVSFGLYWKYFKWRGLIQEKYIYAEKAMWKKSHGKKGIGYDAAW